MCTTEKKGREMELGTEILVIGTQQNTHTHTHTRTPTHAKEGSEQWRNVIKGN